MHKKFASFKNPLKLRIHYIIGSQIAKLQLRFLKPIYKI